MTAGLKITSLLFRTTNLGSRAVVIVVGISHAIFGSLLFGNEIQLLLMFRYTFRVSLSKARVYTPTHKQIHELTKSEKGTT